jgi:hypothetical protein
MGVEGGISRIQYRQKTALKETIDFFFVETFLQFADKPWP